MKYLHVCIFLFICECRGAFNPCNGPALMDESCDNDDDCGALGTYCHPTGVCRCHPHYDKHEETNARSGTTTISCVKLPDKFNQTCDKKCAEPLYCDAGRCVCKFSVLKGNTCVLENGVNGRCSKHTDCTQPFTACVNNKCRCISGTKLIGLNCVAAKHCPLGGQPVRSCVRSTNDQRLLDNIAMTDSKVKTHDCPVGHYCVTAEGSLSGHCCRATCPLQTQPQLRYSCAPDATNPCPEDTHFCHRVSGVGFAYSLCCVRPCQQSGPESVYHLASGKCLERGRLNGSCQRHSDCDGGATMRCVTGKCACKDASFEPQKDALTDNTANPPQQCTRRCGLNGGARDDTCYATRASLNRPCFIQEQCPSGAACFRGRCMCQCGYNTVGGQCVMPTTTTSTTPRSRPGVTQAPQLPDLFGGLLGGQRGGSNPLESFFGGAGSRSSGNGGGGGLGSLLGGLGNLFNGGSR